MEPPFLCTAAYNVICNQSLQFTDFSTTCKKIPRYSEEVRGKWRTFSLLFTTFTACLSMGLLNSRLATSFFFWSMASIHLYKYDIHSKKGSQRLWEIKQKKSHWGWHMNKQFLYCRSLKRWCHVRISFLQIIVKFAHSDNTPVQLKT